MSSPIAPHEALAAAQAAGGKVAMLRRYRRPGVAEADGDLTAARTIYAIATVLEKCPPMSPAGKAKVLALIDSAPVIEA